MALQVIRMPNRSKLFSEPRYAIFSDGTNRWVQVDLPPEKVVEFFRDRAAADAVRDTLDLLKRIAEDPASAYYQFTLTFEEANRKSAENGGARINE